MNKFLFLAVPRSGSTSVRALLDPFSDIASQHISESREHHHLTYQELVGYYPEVKDYKKFIVIRHPTARYLSLYRHHVNNVDGIVRQLHGVSPSLGRFFFALTRLVYRGRLMASVSKYTEGADFVVFSLEDDALKERLSKYLGIQLDDVPHLNSILLNSSDTLSMLERLLLFVAYRSDVLLFNKVIKNGSWRTNG